MDISLVNRGDAAAARRIFRGDESRRAAGTRKFGLDRRPPRYISKKEQRERGWFFQPAPLLKNIAGIRFPKLRELTLVYIDLDTNSFAGTRRRV